ncbi:MAG: aminopeptidase [Azospira oryzae]|nr:MAG: aminopeptidase [Azospira oryzae]
MKKLILLSLLFIGVIAFAQTPAWQGKFEQLDQTLPTPNSYRNSAGAPGANYWQQRADYVIDVEVNDDTHVLTGKETITYHNNAPEPLTYLWLQLDQNILKRNSISRQSQGGRVRDSIAAKSLSYIGVETSDYQGGYTISSVTDAAANKLPYIINNTMMRIDLPAPLKSGEKFVFNISWNYTEYDRMVFNERGGYEYFPADGNYVYTFAQWFPRMCVFDDYEGWQNKQFLGNGEFALVFGNYKVRITVPSDHIIGATGWLQNPKEVLTKEQQERFETARKTFDKQTWIVTEEEARKKEKVHSKKKSTWEFHAENVRDFAFASSRKFIWDAQAVRVGDKTPLAQSLYPKEGNPLWGKESTKAIKNTLEVYSSRTFDYPYPTAFSVHAANQGMEYPMICFNYGRPDKDGKYSPRVLEGMLGVVVHEVGHNFFPMIVNNDERQSTWMDEGLNSFLEGETIRERYPELEYKTGLPETIIPFMKGNKNVMRPVIATADNQANSHGPNGYDKPAVSLTLLRTTIMGPELFDKAFKEYAQRWAFKHPKAADFFRTMEDASAIDLDWFWRGWYYTTDNVDLTLDEVKWYKVKNTSVDPEKNVKVKGGDLNAQKSKSTDKATDFSNGPQEFTVIKTPENAYGDFKSRVDDKAILDKLQGKNIYELTLVNKGGLVSPVIIEWTFKDGSKEIERIPAEIWRLNETKVIKTFVKEKEVVNVVIDPNKETVDVNVEDNAFPRKPAVSKFDELKKN